MFEKSKILLILLFINLSLGSPSSFALDDEIPQEIVIYHYANNFVDEDGNSTDAGLLLLNLQSLLKKANIRFRLAILPWNRIVRETKGTNNSLILGMVRNEYREKNYHWLLPVALADNKVSIFTRAGQNMEGKSIKQLIEGNYKAICTHNSAHCHKFQKLGFPEKRIFKVSMSEKVSIEKLLIRGRGDIMMTYHAAIEEKIKMGEFGANKLIPIIPIKSQAIFVTAPISLHPDLIRKILKEGDVNWEQKIGTID